MKVSKAIEILTNFDNGKYPGGAVVFFDAVKLGIEALKRTIRHRDMGLYGSRALLPGETPEEEG